MSWTYEHWNEVGLIVSSSQKPHFSQRTREMGPLAQIYAALNKNGDTFKWLQAAYEDHAVWVGYLAVDPIFDSYRSDERFKDLLKRVGLP